MDRVTHRVSQTVLRKSNEFIAALQSRGIHVERAYLYGSHATGHAQRGSDIDIAVVSPDLGNDWLDNFVRLTRIADDIDPRMEVVSFLPGEFRDENSLVGEIKATGIRLVGNGKNGNRCSPHKRTTPRASKRT